MPLAVTHVILTIIAVDLYRDYVAKHKRYFTLWTVFVAGVAGLIPDIDILLYPLLTTLNIDISLLAHGQITHTPIFASVFLIPFAILWLRKKHRLGVIFLVVFVGIMSHILLDYVIKGGDENGLMFFYPFSTERYKIFLLDGTNSILNTAGLDAIILLLWLLHEEWKHKIKDYI